MSLQADLTKLVSETLFPWECLVCQKHPQAICESCLGELTLKSPQVCLVCLKPSLEGLTHPVCQNKYSANACYSHFDYGDSNVSELIISGKYRFYKEIFRTLTRPLAQSLQEVSWVKNLPPNAVICPLPLHSHRQSWRGFNQSSVISTVLAQTFNMPVVNLLQRHKVTKTQKDLDLEHRLKNMLHAFSLKTTTQPWWHKLVEPISLDASKSETQRVGGSTILLVDDVRTTGATLSAATKVLKARGAKTIYCITLTAE